MALLDLDGVEASYGRIRALRGISLAVDKGEIVALIGSNGAGKTTTLRTISGLMHPAGCRAADVREGSRADGETKAPDARRALARTLPPPGRDDLRHRARDQRPGHSGAARRAECAQGAGDRESRLRAGDRGHRPDRDRQGAARIRRREEGLPGHVILRRGPKSPRRIFGPPAGFAYGPPLLAARLVARDEQVDQDDREGAVLEHDVPREAVLDRVPDEAAGDVPGG